jgi:hypothetical protein
MRPSCGALLGDVHARHQLEAAEQRVLHALGQVVALDAHAVDAVPQPHTIGHRLDVDIADARMRTASIMMRLQASRSAHRRRRVDRLVHRAVHGAVDDLSIEHIAEAFARPLGHLAGLFGLIGGDDLPFLQNVAELFA